jgi:predicted DNA-binding transcriptional regulator AlpA
VQTETHAPIVLTPAEAAARLLTKPRTLERWRTNGTGPRFVRIGRRVGYRPEDITAFVASQVRSHTGEKPRNDDARRDTRAGA